MATVSVGRGLVNRDTQTSAVGSCERSTEMKDSLETLMKNFLISDSGDHRLQCTEKCYRGHRIHSNLVSLTCPDLVKSTDSQLSCLATTSLVEFCYTRSMATIRRDTVTELLEYAQRYAVTELVVYLRREVRIEVKMETEEGRYLNLSLTSQDATRLTQQLSQHHYSHLSMSSRNNSQILGRSLLPSLSQLNATTGSVEPFKTETKASPFASPVKTQTAPVISPLKRPESPVSPLRTQRPISPPPISPVRTQQPTSPVGTQQPVSPVRTQRPISPLKLILKRPRSPMDVSDDLVIVTPTSPLNESPSVCPISPVEITDVLDEFSPAKTQKPPSPINQTTPGSLFGDQSLIISESPPWVASTPAPTNKTSDYPPLSLSDPAEESDPELQQLLDKLTKAGKAARKKESEAPTTPIASTSAPSNVSIYQRTPGFAQMDTPKLKAAVDKFGLKQLSKKKAVAKLTEIHRFQNRKFLKCTNEAMEEETRAPIPGKRRRKTSSTKENSLSGDSEEEGTSSTRNETRKTSRAVELKSQIVSAVNFDRDLYNRILHFTPIRVTEIQEKIALKAGVTAVINVLDELGITHITPDQPSSSTAKKSRRVPSKTGRGYKKS
eukprot:sb/3463135/